MINTVFFLSNLAASFANVPEFHLLIKQHISFPTSKLTLVSQLIMPEDALIGVWKRSAHKLWLQRLKRTSSLHELLHVSYFIIFQSTTFATSLLLFFFFPFSFFSYVNIV